MSNPIDWAKDSWNRLRFAMGWMSDEQQLEFLADVIEEKGGNFAKQVVNKVEANIGTESVLQALSENASPETMATLITTLAKDKGDAFIPDVVHQLSSQMPDKQFVALIDQLMSEKSQEVRESTVVHIARDQDGKAVNWGARFHNHFPRDEKDPEHVDVNLHSRTGDSAMNIPLTQDKDGNLYIALLQDKREGRGEFYRPSGAALQAAEPGVTKQTTPFDRNPAEASRRIAGNELNDSFKDIPPQNIGMIHEYGLSTVKEMQGSQHYNLFDIGQHDALPKLKDGAKTKGIWVAVTDIQPKAIPVSGLDSDDPTRYFAKQGHITHYDVGGDHKIDPLHAHFMEKALATWRDQKLEAECGMNRAAIENRMATLGENGAALLGTPPISELGPQAAAYFDTMIKIGPLLNNSLVQAAGNENLLDELQTALKA